jgi:hypothetical protein
VNSPPPKPEVILTNFFAEPTVLLVPITSRVIEAFKINFFFQILAILCENSDFTKIHYFAPLQSHESLQSQESEVLSIIRHRGTSKINVQLQHVLPTPVMQS